jgi:hypothetical protein
MDLNVVLKQRQGRDKIFEAAAVAECLREPMDGREVPVPSVLG